MEASRRSGCLRCLFRDGEVGESRGREKGEVISSITCIRYVELHLVRGIIAMRLLSNTLPTKLRVSCTSLPSDFCKMASATKFFKLINQLAIISKLIYMN